jgi:FMN phosphatase YigB (HAD superfamily)
MATLQETHLPHTSPHHPGAQSHVPGSPPPEVVVFDLGKVLLDFDYGRAARALAAESRVDAPTIAALIDQSPLLMDLESGRITSWEFIHRVRHHTGYSGSDEAFKVAFADIFGEIQPMISLLENILDAGLKAYVFSNTNDIAIDHIRSRHPFFERFHGHVLSYEVGCMKPDARIYEVVEDLAGRDGPRLLYLDDRLENVETARQRGWQTIHHTHPDLSIPSAATILNLPIHPQGGPSARQ